MRLVIGLSLFCCVASAAPPGKAEKKIDLRKTELFLSKLDGGTTTLAPYAGKKVTLVNLWATWCNPCVSEMPALAKLYDKYKARGFEVVGIDVDENPALVKQFLAKHPVSYPVLASTPNKTIAALGNLEALPTSLLLDDSGDVTDVLVGVLEIPALTAELDKKLAAPKKR